MAVVTTVPHRRSLGWRVRTFLGQAAVAAPVGVVVALALMGASVHETPAWGVLVLFALFTFFAWGALAVMASLANPEYAEGRETGEFLKGIVMFPVWLLAQGVLLFWSFAGIAIAVLAIRALMRH